MSFVSFPPVQSAQSTRPIHFSSRRSSSSEAPFQRLIQALQHSGGEIQVFDKQSSDPRSGASAKALLRDGREIDVSFRSSSHGSRLLVIMYPDINELGSQTHYQFSYQLSHPSRLRLYEEVAVFPLTPAAHPDGSHLQPDGASLEVLNRLAQAVVDAKSVTSVLEALTQDARASLKVSNRQVMPNGAIEATVDIPGMRRPVRVELNAMGNYSVSLHYQTPTTPNIYTITYNLKPTRPPQLTDPLTIQELGRGSREIKPSPEQRRGLLKIAQMVLSP